MDQDLLKSRARAAVEELKATYKDLRAIKGLAGAAKGAGYVVRHVEALGKTLGVEGADKKALAVEIIMQLVPLPPWLPDFVVRPIVGWLIERAVTEMKKLAAKLGGTK